MRRLTGMAASLLLHGMIAVPVVWASLRRSAEVSPLAPIEMMALEDDRPGDLVDVQKGGTRCRPGKGYVGIGVESDVHHRITSAPESYPAFKAGLRKKDILADPGIEPDADGYESIDIVRRGSRHHLRIKTQWICLE